MNTPKNLRYAGTDEWISEDGTIGISDYAQDQLSDIVYVEFNKEPGDSLEKGEVIATIESVKAAADVNAPVGGKIVKINEALQDTPEALNEDPYDKGWLFKIEITNASELNNLYDAEGYDKYCESRD